MVPKLPPSILFDLLGQDTVSHSHHHSFDVERTIYRGPGRGGRIRKPFTGKCRICQKKGHKALECPVRAWQLRQAVEEKKKEEEEKEEEKAAEKPVEKTAEDPNGEKPSKGGEDVAMSVDA
ncbi:hypothetical protein BGZ61DRAFT_587061 [Ilyonectria robusta]|uniref:uncharacterized protein n=1 Tax=Ilyonectria robusta TaxID=1079257 RepID=UPI001E8EEDD4|nr:uncharacterized protein BGZ61DRAFT_587061 [Ilyonectria robusta]KAH8714259.1 hypothetical protein BGZ61DRAFT_587061 [Ilyonectria robusta]